MNMVHFDVACSGRYTTLILSKRYHFPGQQKLQKTERKPSPSIFLSKAGLKPSVLYPNNDSSGLYGRSRLYPTLLLSQMRKDNPCVNLINGRLSTHQLKDPHIGMKVKKASDTLCKPLDFLWKQSKLGGEQWSLNLIQNIPLARREKAAYLSLGRHIRQLRYRNQDVLKMSASLKSISEM